MAKWADYLISGILKTTLNGKTFISELFMHTDNGETVGAGKRVSREAVVKLINQGKTFMTIQWNYNKATWTKGADITTIRVDGIEYLRTHKDGTVNDNLEHMLRIDTFN